MRPMLPRFARILVVDDSAVTRKAVWAILEHIELVNVDEAAEALGTGLSQAEVREQAVVASAPVVAMVVSDNGEDSRFVTTIVQENGPTASAARIRCILINVRPT